MPTYLSPGVYPQEINVGVLASSSGPLRPVFLGTAKKGPLNTPTLCTSAQQAIDTFGEPFSESYMMYAVLAYFEEGSECYIVRVGVRCEDGQDSDLDAICIDDSGNKERGWGRIPVFTGIDYGRLSLRLIDADNPVTFHPASINNIDYNDISESSTDGPTTATLNVVSNAYTGCIDDSFVILITSDPDADEPLVGAGYTITRNSDGEVVAEGTFTGTGGTTDSQNITVADGIEVEVEVTAGRLETNDTFTFTVAPDNRKFEISVEGGASVEYTMPSTTYTSVAAFVTAVNNLLSGEDYLMVSYTNDAGVTVPQFRTDVAGERIQLLGDNTCGFASEMGTDLYAYDIPRSHLIGIEEGPYNITSSNNRIKLNVIGTTTTEIELTIPATLGLTAAQVATYIDLAGTVAGDDYLDSFALVVPGGASLVAIVATVDHQFEQLRMLANFSNSKTLRFAEEVGIAYPYTRAYRGYSSNTLYLPDAGVVTTSEPLSCEDSPSSDECAEDTAYFAGIVGWLIATSPGSWLTDYTVTLENFTEGVGDTAGRYKLTIKDNQNVTVDVISDISFDPDATRYIGNVINPGSSLGGANGNAFVNWEHKPDYISTDVRQPSQFSNKEFAGMANGIPLDAALSTVLDSEVIGRQSDNSGLYSISNNETLDVNLVAVPGFTSGAVVGQALQICEARGDCLFLVDPPFGLRPQQVIDWHNGMLTSDLTAAINSSYGALYYSWIQINDQFSRERIWVPPSGHVAAVFSRTARQAEQWSAPAGTRRGRLLTAIDTEFELSNSDRNALYGSGNAVNPITKLAQEGIVVYGQRTLQRTEGVTDRVNVRMLLSNIKKNGVRLLRSFIFEANDRITRAQVKSTLDNFMADVQSRRGLDGFLVVCDETNNTPERIARHELWVSVFFRPQSVAEFVVLNLVTLQTSATFNAEEVLLAGGVVVSG